MPRGENRRNVSVHFRRLPSEGWSKSSPLLRPARAGLPQGTLDLLILQTLALESGWAISKRLAQISGASLTLRQGSIYPALHPLGASRMAKRGRSHLEVEISAWRRLTDIVAQVLESV